MYRGFRLRMFAFIRDKLGQILDNNRKHTKLCLTYVG